MLRPSVFLLLFAFVFTGCGSSNTPGGNAPPSGPGDGQIEHVIHISVDGLRPDAVTRFLDTLPAFARLRRQGAYTDNARTAPTRGNTLPNHASQITGRVVDGEEGHGWGTNRYPDTTLTLHNHKGEYVSSVFDVVHAAGRRAALFTSKSKFAVFENSYRDVLDAYVYDPQTSRLTDHLIDSLRADAFDYAFLHLRDPDTAGHRFGWRLWGWHPYVRSVRNVDRQIGRILAAIESDPHLRGTTALIVTADHGGHNHSHGADDRRDYTIPFYVWGPGIRPGDLYKLAEGVRVDPGTDQIQADAKGQPIRNGDAANLALSLLGLDAIDHSTLGAETPLPVREPTLPTF